MGRVEGGSQVSQNNWTDNVANKFKTEDKSLVNTLKDTGNDNENIKHSFGGENSKIDEKLLKNYNPILADGIIFNDPKEIIENIRNANGKVSQYTELVGFQSKVNNMSTSDLKEARDYLVKEMAKPNNNDDELLGTLLNTVNKTIDGRNQLKPIFEPIHQPVVNPFEYRKNLHLGPAQAD